MCEGRRWGRELCLFLAREGRYLRAQLRWRVVGVGGEKGSHPFFSFFSFFFSKLSSRWGKLSEDTGGPLPSPGERLR